MADLKRGEFRRPTLSNEITSNINPVKVKMPKSDNYIADVVVVAGTSDARKIISELAELNLKVAATVTTSFGGQLIELNPNVRVFEKKLTAHGMAKVLKQYSAKCLIDASHPYAVEASKNAMRACDLAGIKYLRFERDVTRTSASNLIIVKDFEEAAERAQLLGGNILLTIGSKNISTFINTIPDFANRLFVRVLPDGKVISDIEKLGIPKGNIIAMKGPFSQELNKEIIKHIDAKILVTKDSGIVGGTEQKLSAAGELEVSVIVVDRPHVVYKEKVASIAEAVFWVGNSLAVKG